MKLFRILQSIFSNFIGPPDNFCYLKPDGPYANPKDQNKFFQCIGGVATACLPCATSTQIFHPKCNRCIDKGKSKEYYLFYFVVIYLFFECFPNKPSSIQSKHLHKGFYGIRVIRNFSSPKTSQGDRTRYLLTLS